MTSPFLVVPFTPYVEAEPLVSTATGSFFGAEAANVKYLLLIYGNEQSRQIWDQMSAENRLTGLAAYDELTAELVNAGS